MTDLESRRAEMLEWQLARRGIRNSAVLEAFASVPREQFIERSMWHEAYADHPLAIGGGQTISQPYIVALMVQSAHLSPQSRVLEIGAGSGYVSALLATMVAEVWGIERLPELADAAAERLERLGYANAQIVHGDGTLGLAKQAPYDAIIVSAAGPSLPRALLEQLSDGGRLVMPLEQAHSWQELVVITRVADEWQRTSLGGVRFVRLIGEQGWPERSRLGQSPKTPDE